MIMKKASSTFKKNEDTRIWCEYCRIFVYNNRINRDKHDDSPQHKENFKKKVDTLRKEEEAQKVLNSESSSNKSGKSFYQGGPHSANSAQNISNIKPNNILNLKSCAERPAEKKMILGLSSSDSTKLISRSFEEDINSSPVQKSNSDSKSVTSYVKRKVKEDEKLLFGHNGPAETEQDEDTSSTLESLNMFKKKKTK